MVMIAGNTFESFFFYILVYLIVIQHENLKHIWTNADEMKNEIRAE